MIGAAGDIACDPASSYFNGGQGTGLRCRAQLTSDELVGQGLSAVLPLGDNQYECGGYQAFLQSYDLSWGRVKAITHPAVGNHEYQTANGTDCGRHAAGYFQYFGAAAGQPGQGWYSFDIGSWHLIALNSNCGEISGGCGVGSAQETWLQADLAAHPNACTLAYWHHPRFNSGIADSTAVAAFWSDLYAAGADVVLVGHSHNYERFAPQDPNQNADPTNGIREFVVGTGGEDLFGFARTEPNMEVRNSSTFGVLKLTLHSNSYDWTFEPAQGFSFTDSGTTSCH